MGDLATWRGSEKAKNFLIIKDNTVIEGFWSNEGKSVFGLPEADKEKNMPYVNIRITREGATKEQKQELISGVTMLLRDILGKNPATTFVIIDELDTDNWGIGGETVTELRKRKD